MLIQIEEEKREKKNKTKLDVCKCMDTRKHPKKIFVNKSSSSSSSCLAISTDISEPLSPLLLIVHCFR